MADACGSGSDVPHPTSEDAGASRSQGSFENRGDGVKATWRAEADAAWEKRLENWRRVGLVAMAAVILLPLSLLGLLATGAGVLYICIVAIRYIRSA